MTAATTPEPGTSGAKIPWWAILLIKLACGLLSLAGLYLFAMVGFLFATPDHMRPKALIVVGVVLLAVTSAVAFRRIDAPVRSLAWLAPPLGSLALVALGLALLPS